MHMLDQFVYDTKISDIGYLTAIVGFISLTCGGVPVAWDPQRTRRGRALRFPPHSGLSYLLDPFL